MYKIIEDNTLIHLEIHAFIIHRIAVAIDSSLRERVRERDKRENYFDTNPDSYKQHEDPRKSHCEREYLGNTNAVAESREDDN